MPLNACNFPGFISENNGRLGEFIMDIFLKDRHNEDNFLKFWPELSLTYAVNFFKGRFIIKKVNEIQLFRCGEWVRGGIVSTAYCILFKLFTLRLTRKQVTGLINHCDSPYIRGLGFMYIRYYCMLTFYGLNSFFHCFSGHNLR